jgi:hypothetical protein
MSDDFNVGDTDSESPKLFALKRRAALHDPSKPRARRDMPAGSQSSVYLADRPRDFSTGYFFAFASIFAPMLAARSIPVALANPRA